MHDDPCPSPWAPRQIPRIAQTAGNTWIDWMDGKEELYYYDGDHSVRVGYLNRFGDVIPDDAGIRRMLTHMLKEQR